ncbi:hypothetical protein EUTSA_v10006362mg [Eutrema salsugineum]|uniref:Uncharacterized protein n=1 Tax=Eutrema salsugineum TaxID=72664 RepID=V4LMR4_EUTSA|nr:uncharacterized protein LOC18020335 [Eutrema salsugineum]ESQ43767.1 hypothetical protein EUTSA_v10006362mg [Eutrema salsugineum]
MQRRENDENRGICRRLIRFVVVKLMAGQKQDKSVRKKLIKKESNSDITIHFKQREDSDDSAANTSRPEREREKVIMVVNGSNGSKKMMIHGKSMVSEASFMRPLVSKLEDGRKSHPKPLLNDINKKSDAFIQSRLEKMRNSL